MIQAVDRRRAYMKAYNEKRGTASVKVLRTMLPEAVNRLGGSAPVGGPVDFTLPRNGAILDKYGPRPDDIIRAAFFLKVAPR